MSIYTHLSLDLDAASSVSLYLLCNPNLSVTDVVFVPADFDGKTMKYEDVAIDIYAGDKGIKGDKSAFSSILNIVDKRYKNAFLSMSKFIDAHDSTGDWKSAYNVPKDEKIPTILDTFRWYKRSIKEDKLILNHWASVINGVWLSYNDYNRAKKLALRAQWDGPYVAIIKGSAPLQTCSILFDMGADFVVYESGNNIGVIRSNNNKEHLGNHLVKWFPDWFHHPDGFLSCWGSNKAPKEQPYDTTAEYVAELVTPLT